MKKIIYLSIFIFNINSAIADTYTGILQAISHRTGTTHPVSFTYKLDTSNTENITGTLDIAGPSTDCSGEHELASGSIKNNQVILRTKRRDGFRCGVILFKGEVQGNKLVGKVPWNGYQIDLELENETKK